MARKTESQTRNEETRKRNIPYHVVDRVETLHDGALYRLIIKRVKPDEIEKDASE